MHISSIRLFAAWTKDSRPVAWALIGALALAGCEPAPPAIDADVLVIGAGIAGLSAALEASEAEASVTLVEINSVGGGHAVKAGGLFMVDTPLQNEKGVEDSVTLAVADMLAWGEDADAKWVRRYAAASRPEVYDWLTGLGVEFALLMPAPGETSVPRFHFTRGTSVNVVVPMMHQIVRIDRDSLILGYAGVYSSFLLHAKRAARRHGVPSSEILVELGKRGTIGGQEDMIEDVALNLRKKHRMDASETA